MNAPERIWLTEDDWQRASDGIEYVRADLYENLREAYIKLAYIARYRPWDEVKDACNRALGAEQEEHDD